MDWLTATLVMSVLFILRLALPLAFTAGICALLDRLSRRWQLA